MAAAGSVPQTPVATVGQYAAVPAHQVPVPAPIANQNPIDNLPVNQNPVQDAAFINRGDANQNMRMNAQGGSVMEDKEDRERDWLDWLYSAARLSVLLMIVYFNSNLSRFWLVMSTLLLMYLLWEFKSSSKFLTFHKFRLYLQGDKEPNWLKKLFTDFITFTVKLVVKGQASVSAVGTKVSAGLFRR